MSLNNSGFEVVEDILSAQDAEHLQNLLGTLELAPQRGGVRRIEQLLPTVGALAHSSKLMNIAKSHLSGKPYLVRAIYFEKTPENNWLVTWHQDRTVAVSNRFEIDGWGPWSLKANAWHVQPPIEVLENMVTIRVHLDSATIENGCLKVLPGSHRLGLIPSQKILKKINSHEVVYCEVPAGGAVVMRPHLLHASEKSKSSTPRRVLHFEYSGFQLPAGIAWIA
ncbi:phytanoyl-CoA dioxygenase family protein [Pseudomonas anguilliseptica]|uniref:phytanoyl-CoA dioxygenase family protein n=1 Tax=Pseudomonas anguilliseptica TaxID=53406 RepID=UPI00373697D1